MQTEIIKKRLHDFIESAEDVKLHAIYTLLEEQIEQNEWEYTDEFKAELDKRSREYKSGKVKGVDWEEAKAQLLTPAKSNKK